jgi:formylglycine-generating enzyme required for sulfatase activity
MKSCDYFEAFCRALEYAQKPDPGVQMLPTDLEIFQRVREILPICYEEGADHQLRKAMQRRACAIMLDVSEPGTWQGAVEVYGAAWRLSNVLPDDPTEGAAVSELDVSEQTLRQDLSLMVHELEQQVDQLFADVSAQLTTPGEPDRQLQALHTQLGSLRWPLFQVKDVTASGVRISDYFGAGTVGVRFIDKISDPVVAVLVAVRDLSVPDEAMARVRDVVTGASDLVHRISGAVSGRSDISDSATRFEKRIATFLAAEKSKSNQRTFRDVAEPWCPEMVEMPSGQFLMGSGNPAHQDEIPQHPVMIGYRFAVGRYPLTFQEYGEFCRATARAVPDDNGWGREQRPAINVSWDDAQSYVGWLSEVTGQRYRLLTEAEWEYACRAGSTTQYSFGDEERDLGAHGWYVGNLDGAARPVGQGLPNEFGLYDMHGNVWEWVEDVWHNNYAGAPPADGRAWLEGGNPLNRVLRGGSWVSSAKGLRSSVRFTGANDYVKNNVGLRVARTL